MRVLQPREVLRDSAGKHEASHLQEVSNPTHVVLVELMLRLGSVWRKRCENKG